MKKNRQAIIWVFIAIVLVLIWLLFQDRFIEVTVALLHKG